MRPSTAYAPCTSTVPHDPHWRSGVYCAGRTCPAPAPPVSDASPPKVSEATGTSIPVPVAVSPSPTCDLLSTKGSGGVVSLSHGVIPPAIDADEDFLLECGCWFSEANGRCLSEVTQ